MEKNKQNKLRLQKINISILLLHHWWDGSVLG